MKIFVKVKAGAKREMVKKIDKVHFEVWVKEPPKRGRANKELLKVMAKYFGVLKSQIKIVSGQKSREKVLEIE